MYQINTRHFPYVYNEYEHIPLYCYIIFLDIQYITLHRRRMSMFHINKLL